MTESGEEIKISGIECTEATLLAFMRHWYSLNLGRSELGVILGDAQAPETPARYDAARQDDWRGGRW